MHRHYLMRPGAILTILAVLLAASPARPAYAAGVVVNTNADNTTDDGLCSLREAVTNANNDTLTYDDCAAGSGADVITFAADYTITLNGTPLPDITDADGLTITGNGAANTIVQAAASAGSASIRIFRINAAPATLEAMTIRHGVEASGGGINNAGGTLTLNHVIVSGNQATSLNGGGISSNGGSLTLNNSTVSGNLSANSGGGIFSGAGVVTLNNITVSGNSAMGNGGGVYVNSNSGIVNLNYSTVADNTSDSDDSSAGDGGGIGREIGIFNLKSSIVAGNWSGVSSPTDSDCTGTITSQGYNLTGSGTGCALSGTGDLTVTPSTVFIDVLGPLADNGGATPTHALLAASAARDQVPTGIQDCGSAPFDEDQRGGTRPDNLYCDIGSFEDGPDSVFVVNTDADTDDGSCDAYVLGVSDCSLREAVDAANDNLDVSQITFAADYTITLAGSQLPIVTSEVTVTGNGAANTVIQADASPDTATYRIFEIGSAGSLALNGVTVGNGRCNGSCSTAVNFGGGIYNNGGSLSVVESVVSNNRSTWEGGGLYNNGGLLTVLDSTFSGNQTVSGDGGGLVSDAGSLEIIDSTFSNNSADFGGGLAIYSNTSATVTIRNSHFTGNSANDGGGGLYNDGDDLDLTGGSFANNSAADGGGIYHSGLNLEVADAVFSDNSAQTGGGIYNSDDALTVINSTFSDNDVSLEGGGLFNDTGVTLVDEVTFTGNESTSGDGAGAANYSGTLTITGSTFTANTADFGGGVSSYDGVLTVANSTFAGNSGADDGGGIYNAGDAAVINSTFSANSAANGGAIRSEIGSLSVSNSILANSTAAQDCSNSGTLAAGINNLIESHTGCGIPISTSDPQLDSLADNGGPTLTFALLDNSPAVNAGSDAICAAAPVNNLDQRGVTRPLGPHCDIGSVEIVDPNIHVSIAGANQDDYLVNSTDTTVDSYPSILDGPVSIHTIDTDPFLTSQRVTSGASYNELMGVPPSQFTTEYWFPWYDHGYPSVGGSSMRTWILVGNPDDALTADVDIYIGGTLMNSYSIPPGNNITPRWIGLQDGPVRVVSDIPVFASERVFTVPNNSFNEVMGYPADQFTTEYWFPWYDSVSMNASILVGNTSASLTADVDIFIGPNFMGNYDILPDDTLIQSYPSTINGPVRVVATNGVDIVASEAALSGPTGSFTAYNEVMGYPFDQFDTEYHFPWYDHGYPSVGGSNMRTWILVGNPDDTLTADVDIFIDGALQGSYSVPPNSRITPRWIGLQGGPVRVVSDIPVFTSERVFTSPSNVFNEMMGFPDSEITTEYWFAWYDSVNMTNDILIARP